MTTFQTLFTRHCRHLLSSFGWPEDIELAYSLNYGQGDGVAFYGCLNASDLVRLVPLMVEREHLKGEDGLLLSGLIAGSEMSVVLYRNHFACHYSHANTVGLSAEDYPESLSDSLYSTLLQAIRLDICSLCAAMETDGYTLQEAIYPDCGDRTLIIRNTRNFTISVAEADPEYVGNAMFWDEECQDSCIESLIAGEATLKTLLVTVSNRHTEDILGRSWATEVLIPEGEPVHHWFDRCWLQDATEEARGSIRNMLKAFDSFKVA